MYTKDKLDGTTDMRIRRTRKLLWNALLDLLDVRPFDSLTVQEICDTAMVHRTTFYKHFEDKFALLSFGLAETDVLFSSSNLEERIFHPIRLMQGFQHTKEFRTLVKAASKSSLLSDALAKHAAEAMKRDMLRAQRDGMNFEVPVDMMAAFFTGAIASLCAWWVNDGKQIPADQIDEYLGKMINRSLFIPESTSRDSGMTRGPRRGEASHER